MLQQSGCVACEWECSPACMLRGLHQIVINLNLVRRGCKSVRFHGCTCELTGPNKPAADGPVCALRPSRLEFASLRIRVTLRLCLPFAQSGDGANAALRPRDGGACKRS